MDKDGRTGSAQRLGVRRCGPEEQASWTSGALGRINQGDDAKLAAATEGTAIRIATRESTQEVGPWLAGNSAGHGSGRCIKELSGSGEKLCALSIGQEAEVPDADEAAREHVQEKATDEVGR